VSGRRLGATLNINLFPITVNTHFPVATLLQKKQKGQAYIEKGQAYIESVVHIRAMASRTSR
jgi:hypothetical protein